ncbi:hypothetical protein Ct61P_15135 [Colletotrichum tofieldiae]|nr:hypothetical protein Ct61P_15135 [Colletotrichum tofieldiae]
MGLDFSWTLLTWASRLVFGAAVRILLPPLCFFLLHALHIAVAGALPVVSLLFLWNSLPPLSLALLVPMVSSVLGPLVPWTLSHVPAPATTSRGEASTALVLAPASTMTLVPATPVTTSSGLIPQLTDFQNCLGYLQIIPLVEPGPETDAGVMALWEDRQKENEGAAVWEGMWSALRPYVKAMSDQHVEFTELELDYLQRDWRRGQSLLADIRSRPVAAYKQDPARGVLRLHPGRLIAFLKGVDGRAVQDELIRNRLRRFSRVLKSAIESRQRMHDETENVAPSAIRPIRKRLCSVAGFLLSAVDIVDGRVDMARK